MQNNHELNGKYIGTITKDFVLICDTLKEASYQLRVRKMSDYPIFVLTKDPAGVGQLLLGKEEVKGLNWDVNFSYLEDFVSKMLVKEDRVEAFKEAYKDPEEFCCLFVIDGDKFQNFMFIPFPED